MGVDSGTRVTLRPSGLGECTTAEKAYCVERTADQWETDVRRRAADSEVYIWAAQRTIV